MKSTRSVAPFKQSKLQLVTKALIATGVIFSVLSTSAQAADNGIKKGRETGLPLPRFVSLKSKAVNLRVGPGRKYSIAWQFKKRGLPVEVIQEFDQWRRIRDADGSTGWVLHSLLSGKRTAVVAPWEKPQIEFGKPVETALFDGKGSANSKANVVAKLQAGLIVNVDHCTNNWCELKVKNTGFWLKQEQLWGVYPNETVDG